MTFFKALVAASLVAYAAAECPNACSGHGTCSKFDMCTCFRNWQAADCSQRTCPFDLAHVDTPKGDLNHDDAIGNAAIANKVISGSTVYPYGTNEMFPLVQDSADNILANSAHAYMECSNKGICDRTTGTCECFDGYDGSACQRASCPNSCSGHGTCESISGLANTEYKNVYELWDKDATMGCKCDAGYGAADCSTRSCKYGTDPLYTDDAFGRIYKASYSFSTVADNKLTTTGTYSIVFTDIFGETFETAAITMFSTCAQVQRALMGLPNNALPLNALGTASSAVCTETNDAKQHTITLDFEGNPGNLKPITINEYLDGTRKTVTTVDGDYTLDQWTRQIGENTDHFATKCTGVSVTPTLSKSDSTTWDATAGQVPTPGSVGYLSQTTDSAALLSVCLGDSDGITTNNVDIYNWDHGATQIAVGDGSSGTAAVVSYAMGSFPHAIKIQDTNGASEYVLVWHDATTSRVSTHRMRTANAVALSGSGHDVYTTNGIVKMLGKDDVADESGDTDKLFTSLRNETKLTGYFTKYTNKIYTNFDGSCETTGKYYNKLHSCVEKGDLLFVVDGCWGSGLNVANTVPLTEPFGGLTVSCTGPNTISTGTGMLYTVNKIYTKAYGANTTAFDSDGGPTEKGKEDRFVIEVDHNLMWDGSAIGNPDQSQGLNHQWGAGYTGLVVLFKFTPATDGSSYTYVSECSNRGSCDRETGLCACFKGYTSDDCSSQNSLAV